jgi:hypothetical protein
MVTIVPKNPPEPTDAPLSESKQSLSLQFIAPSDIVSRVEARSVKADGVERLKAKIDRLGFQVDKPIRVYPFESGYRLIDGNHRLEAAIAYGLEKVPALIVEPPANELAAIKQARESNEAAETVVPTTFVDDAELIWRMLDEKKEDGKAKYTQLDVAGCIGWKRGKISNYALLKNLTSVVWEFIATTFVGDVANASNDDVAEDATSVAKSVFSENLLREILDLKPGQQLSLCKLLVKCKNSKGNNFTKKEFKSESEKYRAFNDIKGGSITELLKTIPVTDLAPYLKKAFAAIKSNSEYVNEWLINKSPGVKFQKLIDSLIDEWQEKTSIQIIVKDIRELTQEDIADESVDVIITDPPYPKDYVGLFDDLGKIAARVLKPGGSLIAMTGQYYLPQYIELLSKHLTYHWTLAYTTPGGQAVQVFPKEVMTFWKPLLWFVKCERDAKWVSDVINTPVNANDKQHHHWGQSVEGMTSIIEKFSNPGDIVLDPFLGGGTTGYVCKLNNRKFIGVEVDAKVAQEAKERIHAKN